jgi:hypothetical protein
LAADRSLFAFHPKTVFQTAPWRDLRRRQAGRQLAEKTIVMREAYGINLLPSFGLLQRAQRMLIGCVFWQAKVRHVFH